MNILTRGAVVFLEPEVVDTVLARVASATFAYYPGKNVEEVGYTVYEDVDWAMAPARGLDPLVRAEWRRRIAEVISNPDADRRAFIADLRALAGPR